jgi:hypothetical protein
VPVPVWCVPGSGEAVLTVLRWCTWHGGFAEGVVLVRIIETGSGPGGMLYACPRCRKIHGLEPLDSPERARLPRQ